MSDISKRLKEARELIGYSFVQVCVRSGFSPDMLCDFENDIQKPKFSELSKLASVYKISVEKLMSDKPITGETMLHCEPDPSNTGEKYER